MSKTTPKNEKHDFFEIKSICKTTHIFALIKFCLRMMQVMRISPKQMKKRIFSQKITHFEEQIDLQKMRKSNRSICKWHCQRSEERKTGRKNATRPRRGGYVASREGAEQPAAARLGSGPHGSAAGARGQGAARSPAAAPGVQRRPVPRLQRVARALPEVPSAAGHAAARPLRLCDGARRGGGGSRPGGVVEPLVP